MPVVQRLRTKKTDASAAARLSLQALRESTDAFPLLKSAVSTLLVVWDMSEVCIIHTTTL